MAGLQQDREQRDIVLLLLPKSRGLALPRAAQRRAQRHRPQRTLPPLFLKARPTALARTRHTADLQQHKEWPHALPYRLEATEMPQQDITWQQAAADHPQHKEAMSITAAEGKGLARLTIAQQPATPGSLQHMELSSGRPPVEPKASMVSAPRWHQVATPPFWAPLMHFHLAVGAAGRLVSSSRPGIQRRGCLCQRACLWCCSPRQACHQLEALCKEGARRELALLLPTRMLLPQ